MPEFLSVNVLSYLFIFLIGLCVGSFLNVVVIRGLNNESLIFPPSKCTKCHKLLLWWHKIPVFSYFLLKGKCWFCRSKISFQYPFVEFLTGVLFTVIYFKFGFTLKALFLFFISSGLVVLALTDLKKMVIIGWHAYFLIAISLIYNLASRTFFDSVFGIILGFAIIFLLAKIGYFLSGTKAFGEGDFLIACVLGAALGYKSLLPILIYSIILESFWVIPGFVKKLLSQKDYLTFIMFIVFLVYSVFIYTIKTYPHIYLKYISLVLFILVGVATCKRILKTAKKTRIKIPFGPSLSFCGLIYIFFMP